MYGLLICAVCLLHFQGMGKNVTWPICSLWEERPCVMKHEVCCITATSLPLFYTNLIQLLNFFPALCFVLYGSLVGFYLQLKEPSAWFSWDLEWVQQQVNFHMFSGSGLLTATQFRWLKKWKLLCANGGLLHLCVICSLHSLMTVLSLSFRLALTGYVFTEYSPS